MKTTSQTGNYTLRMIGERFRAERDNGTEEIYYSVMVDVRTGGVCKFFDVTEVEYPDLCVAAVPIRLRAALKSAGWTGMISLVMGPHLCECCQFPDELCECNGCGMAHLGCMCRECAPHDWQ